MKKKALVSSLLALSLLALASCAGGKGGESSSVAPDSSSSKTGLSVVILAPEKTSLEVGEEMLLQAKVEGGDETATVNWYSSDPSVLSVTQKGKIIALKEGSSEVTAKAGEVTSSPLLITVTAKKAPAITLLDPSSSTIEVEQTLQLSVNVENGEGLDVTFLSESDCISLSSSGLVKGLKPGVAKIKARLGENVYSNEIEVTVLEQSKELSVSILTPSSDVVLVGSSLLLQTEVKGNINNYPLTFSSSDPSIAKVDEKGNVTALKVGEVSITASVSNVSSSIALQIIASYDAVESISYSSSSLTIAVNEPFAFEGVTILPKTASQSFTIESGDPLTISVDENEITGRKVTSSPISVLLKAGEKSFEVKVTVATSKALHTGEVLEKLRKAAEEEGEKAQKGHFYKTNSNADGTDAGTYEKYDFEVYEDQKTTAHYQKKNAYTTTSERYTWARLDDRVVKATDTLDDDGGVSSSRYSSYSIVADSEETSSTTYTESEVSSALKLPLVDNGTNPTRLGFAKMVINTFFSPNAHTYFGENSLQQNEKTFTYEKEGDAYTLGIDSMSSTYSSTKEHISLKLTFEGDLLCGISGEIASYKGETNYDDDSKTVWTLSGKTALDGALESGERETSPEGSFSPLDHCATSFEAQFYTGYGSSKKVATSFGIGESFSCEALGILPEAYSSSIDPLTVSFPGHEDIVKRSTYGLNFTINEEVEDLEVVVSTYKVSHVYHLKIEEKKTSTLSFASSGKGLVDEALKGRVNFDKNCAVSLSYKVVGDNADKATLSASDPSLASGYAYFTLLAKEAGEYQVEVTDGKSGLTAIAKYTILSGSDEDISEFILSSSWSGGYGAPSFASQEDGSIKLVVKVSCTDDYYDTQYVTLTVLLKVSDGKLAILSSSNDNSDSELAATSLSFGSTHSSISLKMSINSEWETDPVTLSVK